MTVAAVAHFAEQINYACSAMETGLGKRKTQHRTLTEPRRKGKGTHRDSESERERGSGRAVSELCRRMRLSSFTLTLTIKLAACLLIFL